MDPITKRRPGAARPRVHATRARTVAAAILAGALGLGTGGAAAGKQVVWTDTWFGAPRLYRAGLDGTAPASLPLTDGSLPEGLAYDAPTGALFLGEAAWAGAMIRRTDPTLAAPVPVVAGPSVVRGVAVDPARGLLFWSTTNLVDGCAIRHAMRDGTPPVAVIGLGNEYVPHGVAVDPGRTRIWFTDSNLHRIVRVNYDGSGITTGFALPAGSYPYGIAYDAPADRVYWTEYASGRIVRGDFDGTGMTPIVTGLANPTHLALDPAGGRMYWVEGGYGMARVKSANLDGSGVAEIAALQTFGGIAIVSGPVTGVPGGPPEAAFATGLLAPWPNPAPGAANVAFTLAAEADVELAVHDVAGRRVAVLADGRFGPGPHTARWTPAGARTAPPGVYFVRLRTGDREWTERVVLAR